MGSRPYVRFVLAALAVAAVTAGVAVPAAASVRYRVRPGDTLSAIALAHRTTVGELARLNRLDPNRTLFAGITIRLPGREQARLVSYWVQPGDTLSGIAVRWETSVSRIARLNDLDPDGLLLAGRKLLLPRPKSTRAEGEHAGSTDAVRSAIVRWADHYGVSRALALSVGWMESGYRPGLTSAAGAWGVMQVMPATWAYTETLIGHPVPHTTDGGIRVGVAFLHHLLHVFGNDARLTLAAYLQGEGSARVHGVLPSSRFYVDGILGHAARVYGFAG